MTDEKDQFHFSLPESVRRYIPLAVWVVVLLTLIVIPLKIIGYGYLPGDDALRAAGKAVSGKSWQEILVLNDAYKIDHEYGWSLLLAKIHTLFNADPETILVFSVVSLFVLAGLAAMLWLSYPEVWLIALGVSMIVALLPFRLTLGRPYIISVAALLALLFFWRRFGAGGPQWWKAGVITAFITASVYFHGTWYLWALPVAAFFLAGQFRWTVALAGCWIAGVLCGSLLTGHPIDYPLQAVKIVQLATGKHLTQGTLVSEMQPQVGDITAAFILGGLLILRRLAPLNSPPLRHDPVFWLVCLTWTLNFRVGRFWDDWGWPALMVLIACDLQSLFASRVTFDSARRLGLACGLALMTFLCITADAGGRWTRALTQQYLTADNPDLTGWLPDKGGIFYCTDMSLFYQTLYKNPTGDWRYILGFEATLMPPEDFDTYHKILWNFGDSKSYTPWLLKMKPADRLVIRSDRSNPPKIPQLDWNYGVTGIWVGRLPDHQGGAPATVKATEPISSLTNAPGIEQPKLGAPNSDSAR